MQQDGSDLKWPFEGESSLFYFEEMFLQKRSLKVDGIYELKNQMYMWI